MLWEDLFYFKFAFTPSPGAQHGPAEFSLLTLEDPVQTAFSSTPPTADERAPQSSDAPQEI